MKEEKTKKRNSILKLIMDAFVLLLFSTTCCIQDMAIIPLVHISSKLNNLVKFYSIDLDLAAAGIDQGSMIEQFKKNPLAYRKPVERHKRNRFILLTPEHEKALDQQFVSQMKSMNILWNDPAALQRCNNILNKLAKTMPDHFTPPKEIYILDVPIANASCLPGGSIVIFRGLLYVANDDELAYIIAHELGHGAAHHTAETISKSMLQNWAIDKILDDNSTLLEIAGTHIAQFMINMRYSREQENEADRLALVFMNKAGFQLQGAVTMLKKFQNMADILGEYYELLSSHPHPAKRLENVNRAIGELKQNPDHIWETEDVIEKTQNKIVEQIPDLQKKIEEKAPVTQKKIEEKFPGLQDQVKEKAKEKLKGRFRF